MTGFYIFLGIWSVVGMVCATPAADMVATDRANIKQQIFIGFLLGPILWGIFAFFGIIYSFIWVYEFLGKKPSTIKNK